MKKEKIYAYAFNGIIGNTFDYEYVVRETYLKIFDGVLPIKIKKKDSETYTEFADRLQKFSDLVSRTVSEFNQHLREFKEAKDGEDRKQRMLNLWKYRT